MSKTEATMTATLTHARYAAEPAVAAGWYIVRDREDSDNYYTLAYPTRAEAIAYCDRHN